MGVTRIGQRQVVEANRFIVGGGNFEATIEVLDLTYLITIHKSMDLPTCNFALVNETTARLIFVGDMGPHGSFWYYEHAGMYGGRYFDLSIHVQTVADQPPLTPAWAVTYTFSFQANIPATNVLAGPFSGKANE